MKNILDTITNNTLYHILTIIAVILLIASFILPPLGIIDNSVLIGGSLIFAFASLTVLYEAVKKGNSATMSHGQTSIEVKSKKKVEGVE